MRDTPERDLAVADELGRMADARIRELESERREFQALIRMCLQQFEFQYGKRARGWDAKFLMDRCEALLGIQVQDTAIDTSSAFADYLPLTPVRLAPGEYVIKDRNGRTLWTMDGAALADWVCQSTNGYDSAIGERDELSEEIETCHAMLDAFYSEDPEMCSADTLEKRLKVHLDELRPVITDSQVNGDD